METKERIVDVLRRIYPKTTLSDAQLQELADKAAESAPKGPLRNYWICKEMALLLA